MVMAELKNLDLLRLHEGQFEVKVRGQWQAYPTFELVMDYAHARLSVVTSQDRIRRMQTIQRHNLKALGRDINNTKRDIL